MEPSPHASPSFARPLRLLLVDDNADGAEMLAMYLEACGHQVAVEHCGDAALKRVAGEVFDAYLLDIGLPGMDGKELARRLRRLPGQDQATLIAVTGYGQQGDGDSALEAGFDHYMVKPVKPDAILSLLEHLPRS